MEGKESGRQQNLRGERESGIDRADLIIVNMFCGLIIILAVIAVNRRGVKARIQGGP
jgi:hypothetical protein